MVDGGCEGADLAASWLVASDDVDDDGVGGTGVSVGINTTSLGWGILVITFGKKM